MSERNSGFFKLNLKIFVLKGYRKRTVLFFGNTLVTYLSIIPPNVGFKMRPQIGMIPVIRPSPVPVTPICLDITGRNGANVAPTTKKP